MRVLMRAEGQMQALKYIYFTFENKFIKGICFIFSFHGSIVVNKISFTKNLVHLYLYCIDVAYELL